MLERRKSEMVGLMGGNGISSRNNFAHFFSYVLAFQHKNLRVQIYGKHWVKLTSTKGQILTADISEYVYPCVKILKKSEKNRWVYSNVAR